MSVLPLALFNHRLNFIPLLICSARPPANHRGPGMGQCVIDRLRLSERRRSGSERHSARGRGLMLDDFTQQKDRSDLLPPEEFQHHSVLFKGGSR